MANDISTDVLYIYTNNFFFFFFFFFKIRVYKRNNERLIEASLFLFFVDPLLD